MVGKKQIGGKRGPSRLNAASVRESADDERSAPSASADLLRLRRALGVRNRLHDMNLPYGGYSHTQALILHLGHVRSDALKTGRHCHPIR
eukprot:1815665-Pyramimonas_sp.AAC.1